MSKNLGTGTPLNTLGYASTNEEILGYLIQGLAEWHYGDAMTGAAELEYFAQHLIDVKTGAGTATLDWVPMYAGVVALYEKDIAVARSMQSQANPSTIAGCQKALEEVKLSRSKLERPGTLRKMLDRREGDLRRELARLRMDEQRQQMAEQRSLRQRELAQLAEITATVPSLVQGYDYSRAVDLLKDIRFESSEVQAALEGQRYLYEQAQAFLTQLFADISTKGYQGKLQRREGSVLEGKVTAANMEKLTISLERGIMTVPLESVLPETLLHAAQFFATQTTDSADYYLREERIAVFARVAGLHQFSATIAAQLMEENREFRTRWMKVVQ
jgi:hypothetical protein